METSVVLRYILRSLGGKSGVARAHRRVASVGLSVSESCSVVRVSICSTRRRKFWGRYASSGAEPLLPYVGLGRGMTTCAIRLGPRRLLGLLVWRAKLCGWDCLVLRRRNHMHVRDADEMVFIDPSRNTDHGV
jgi:hypothetical protein